MARFQTATQWGIYDVEVIDGVIVDVFDHTADPAPSPLGKALVDGVQHELRVKRPAIRRGWLNGRNITNRGDDEFVDVPWDEALELAAQEISRIAREHGNTSIFAGSYGWASAGRFNHAQSQLHRFINLAGGSTRAMNSYSTAAAQVILPHVVAPWHEVELAQANWQEISDGCELFVAFGGIPLRNTQVAYGGITEHQSQSGLKQASESGVEFFNISPIKGDVPEWLACRWVPIRPGTDVALMLGVAHVLETRGWVDREFLASHCVGYEQFRSYLLGQTDGIAKSPLWAQKICAVNASVMVELAKNMAGKRTFLAAAWALQRAQFGEQPYWMTVTLAAMLGDIGLAGGGFGFGYGAEGFIGSAWRRFNWANHSKGMNPTRFAIPVARIADMLLNPGKTIDYDGQQITYPDTKLIYWAGGNPFHHHQDLNRLCAAWRRPDTVIVNEPWWTPVAQWADIVFPATTQLERIDICASSHDPYAHLMEQVIPPQYEAKSDHDIFAGLADKLGLLEKFSQGKDDKAWLQDMWQRSAERAEEAGFSLPSFDQFYADKTFKIPDINSREPWLAKFRRDPKNNRLNTPSGKLEIFSSVIETFGYADCPPHPTWLEPVEWLGADIAQQYPLHLLSPQPERRLHSQFDHSQHSQASKIEGKEVLTMHPHTAHARGIGVGHIVRVFNERGACLAGVQFESNMLEDVVLLPTGAWFRPSVPADARSLELNGNPNVLTLDAGTSSLSQGPSANTCLVEVEKYEG